MLNILWCGMILAAVLCGAAAGQIGAVGTAAVDSAKEAVTLCVTMLGVMSLWMGLMRIAKASGLIDRLTRMISPLLSFLFPRIPENHPAKLDIASNLIANFLGLGWAATPFGLRAMKSLSQLEEERRQSKSIKTAVPEGTANHEMCTFLILNISSLQLIPVNMIAYRSQYGSANPASILAPAIIATAASTAAAILFCRLMSRTGACRGR